MTQLLSACILCTILFTSCSDTGTAEKPGKLAGVVFKKVDYGDKWPFSVDQIESYCAGPGKDEIYFRASGKVYALNGSAQRAAEGKNSTKVLWRKFSRFSGATCVY